MILQRLSQEDWYQRLSGILITLQDGCDRRADESNIFLTNPRNPNLSTRAALKRAQQLLGTDKADIWIFYDPSQQPAAT